MNLQRRLPIVLVLTLGIPVCALANGMLEFNVPLFNLGSLLQISSVEGSGGTAHSGTTLAVSNGSLGLTCGAGGCLSLISGGTLDITASGTIGPLSLTGQTLLQASFSSANISTRGLTLDGFSGTVNPTLAGYYGLGDSAVSGSVYLSGLSGVLAVGTGTAIATPEAGGFPATLAVLLAGVLLCFWGTRLKIITPIG